MSPHAARGRFKLERPKNEEINLIGHQGNDKSKRFKNAGSIQFGWKNANIPNPISKKRQKKRKKRRRTLISEVFFFYKPPSPRNLPNKTTSFPPSGHWASPLIVPMGLWPARGPWHSDPLTHVSGFPAHQDDTSWKGNPTSGSSRRTTRVSGPPRALSGGEEVASSARPSPGPP